MMGLRNHGGKSISQTAPKAREQALVGNFLNNATWNDNKVGNLAKIHPFKWNSNSRDTKRRLSYATSPAID